MTRLSEAAKRKLSFYSLMSEIVNVPLLYLGVNARDALDALWSAMPLRSLAVVGFEPYLKLLLRYGWENLSWDLSPQ